MLFHKPDIIYFPIVPHGISFYRDSIIVFLIKLFRIPLVYHLHGKGAKEHYHRVSKIYDYVYKNVNVVCLSENLINEIDFLKELYI